jgi:TRAP-type C4-dicarboxylate transport system permease large subunit
MFILMGLSRRPGLSTDLFRASQSWLGHYRGGLAMSAIAACGGFAAINGSSVATAATMTNVALPELRKAGYDAGLSAGVIAAGGTLGIMIPPSVIFVLYGIMTQTDIGSCSSPASCPARSAPRCISSRSGSWPGTIPGKCPPAGGTAGPSA